MKFVCLFEVTGENTFIRRVDMSEHVYINQQVYTYYTICLYITSDKRDEGEQFSKSARRQVKDEHSCVPLT